MIDYMPKTVTPYAPNFVELTRIGIGYDATSHLVERGMAMADSYRPSTTPNYDGSGEDVTTQQILITQAIQEAMTDSTAVKNDKFEQTLAKALAQTK